MSRSNLLSTNSSHLLQFIIFLLGLYTLYFAKSLLIPLVLALMLALLLSPLVTWLQHYKIPRTVSSVLLLSLFIGAFLLLAIQLIEPVRKWTEILPQLSEAISQRLDTFGDNMDGGSTEISEQTNMPDVEHALFADFFAQSGDVSNGDGADDEAGNADAGGETGSQDSGSADTGSQLSSRLQQAALEAGLYLLSATPIAIVQLLTVLILVLFLLIFGPNVFQAYARNSDRVDEDTLHMLDKVRSELGHYVLAICVINTGLGLVTAGVLYLLGLEDALLWGMVCGLLNFAPYVGPLVSLGLLLVASLAQFGMVWYAIAPPLAFFTVNAIEANFFTPTVLGYRLRLNPSTLIVWLFIWGG